MDDRCGLTRTTNEVTGRDTKPAEMSENVKRYKPLLSSAPAHSILNAQAFHYTNAVATDIRRTFARIRRERASAAVVVNLASHVRSVPTKACDSSLPSRSVMSTAR
jgi:hypothetical protein